MADRNVWDPPTPTGNINFTKRSLVVELFIYVLEHASRNEKNVRAEVEEASVLWCQGTINIQAVQFAKLGTLTPSEPINFNSADIAGEINCGSLSDSAFNQFLQLLPSGPGSPDLTQAVAVFYIPGPRFQDGGTGCHHFTVAAIDVKPKHIILLTDEADGRVLAHELGHALFTREGSTAGMWLNDDPDPKRNPIDKIHNTDGGNLMFPKVPANPVISTEQIAQAKKSELTHDRNLVFGFKENKQYKLGVRFKVLQVNSSTDEVTSDDELESQWHFTASVLRTDGTVVTTQAKDWDRKPLEIRGHLLSGTGAEADLDFPNLQTSSETDKLVIEVTGTDVDFGPNDMLPPVKEEWLKGKDNWGSESTNIIGAQPGDHVQHEESGDINYDLTYNVRVDERPNEVTFRVLC